MQYFISHKNSTPPNNLSNSFENLKKIIGNRIESHFGLPVSNPLINSESLLPQELLNYFPENTPGIEESVILLSALAPHVIPNFFESIVSEKLPTGGDFPEFGGVKGGNHRGILPTGETIQFILGGGELNKRFEVFEYFDEEHYFFRNRILWLEPVKEGEPRMSGRIIMAGEWIEKILRHKESSPRFGIDFPARKITTNMIWEDAVLHPQTGEQIKDILNWLKFGPKLLEDENLKRKIKPGYRVLFFGPSGTGKTLTAALLGKQSGRDVYRIDLSQIVSKFIGETEKNLEMVFSRAESRNWILFFDEADALFGKRTNVQSSHDKYANQEVSYLLQRVEEYPGLMILASNFKNNLDDAFIRRFHSLVHFPMPNANDRYAIWEKSLPSGLALDKELNLKEFANKYEMSGASILNAMQFAVLQCYTCNQETLNKNHIYEGIRRELQKEEKTMI